MSIIYIISIILLFVLVMLIEKTKEKTDIIKTIIITFTLLLAYNTFSCYILNLINMPITLLSLGIINFIISTILLIFIIKDKKIQKYYVNKTNILIVIIFVLLTGIIININFDGLSKIRYVSMDAREHYKAAREFSENTALSNKAKENNTTSTSFMPMGYANVGILFKIFNQYIGTVNLYKIFILFEAFVYLLNALMFYMLIEKYANKISSKIISVIFCIIYVLGYPLNAWISGFHYLLIGILLIETILYINLQKDILNLKCKILILFFLNFGLILSYSLFCPFVYLAEFIYYCYEYKKGKVKIFLLTLITLVLPGIIGVTYLLLPNYGTVGEAIAHEGWIYKNLWSNFILFIPFTIYSIYNAIKEKKFTFDNLLLILLILYMILLFIGTKTGKCAEYYFHKNYYIFWLLILYLNTKTMLKLLEEGKQKYIIYIYIIVYLIIFGLSIKYQKTYINQKENENLNKTMEIFTFNNTMINARNSEFVKKEELQLLKETENIIGDNWLNRKNDILFVIDPTQERWIQSITGYKNILYDDRDFAIENLKEENYKYIVTFENRNTYQNIKKYINEENMEIVYENSIGKIYEKKEE